MTKGHITSLDGVRGCLALWVFWGHVSVTVGRHIPVLSQPGLAVDLFMLLSGFLMAWNWELKTDPAESLPERIRKFWIRRFFRIAPLYYPILFISYWLTPRCLEAQHQTESVFPPPWAEELRHFVSTTDYAVSFQNILAHLTFAFGLIPKYVSNNYIPDWSLSLEMQFYLLFPLLILFIRPSRILFYVTIAVALSLLTDHFFGLYLAEGPLGNFAQPSLLTFKLHVFAAGMALGWLTAQHRESGRIDALAMIAFVLPLVFVAQYVALLALLISALVLIDFKPVNALRHLLSGKIGMFLGAISYPLYLIHLIPMWLAVNYLLKFDWFVHASSTARFAFAVALLTPLLFAGAYLLHRAIERPGIGLGRRLTRRKTARHPAA